MSRVFGGGPKCPVCGKSVYQAEEVNSAGQKFHRQCFNCFHCKKAIALGKQAVDKGHVYCQPCYNGLFRIAGYGVATGITSFAVQKVSQGGTEGSNSLPVSQGGTEGSKTSVASVVSSRSAPAPAPVSSSTLGKSKPTPLKKKFSDDEIQQLRALFSEFDTNKSSSISSAEAKTCLSRFGIKLSDSQAQGLIDSVDSDHSGEINFIEFLRLCEVGFAVQQQEEVNKKPTEREFVPPPASSSTVQVYVGDANLVIDVSKVAITNPYVLVLAVNAEQKTSTVKASPKEGGQTAEWRQDLSFSVPSGTSPSSVEFQLWHTGENGQPEQISSGLSKLDGAKNNKQAVSVPLIEAEDNEQIGTLNVVLLYSPEEAEVVAKEVKKKNAVFIVWKGKVLQKQDVIGKGDPFVVISVGGKEQKTRTVKNTQEPVWEQVLAFTGISSAEASAPVTVTLLDEDTITKNDLIGTANPPLSLGPFTNKPGHIVVPVFDKKGVEQGNVELEVVLGDEDGEGGGESVWEKEFAAAVLAAKEATGKAAAEEAARVAAEKAAAEEAARIAAEKAAAEEAARIAAEEEAARIAAEKAAAEEAARIAAEKAAAEEAARIAAEEEAARIAAEKAAAEEAARIAAEKAAAEEAARIAAEKAAAEEAARIAAEKAAAEEAARIAAEEEAARIAAEKAAAEEAARIAAEKAAAEEAAEKVAVDSVVERKYIPPPAAGVPEISTVEVHVGDANLAIDVSKVAVTDPWVVVQVVNAEQKTGTAKAAAGEDKQTAEWGQDLSFNVPAGTSLSSVEFQLWHTGEDGQPEHIGTGSSKLDGEKNSKQAVSVPLIESEDNEQIGTLNVVLLLKSPVTVEVHVGNVDLAIDVSKVIITDPWVVVRAVNVEQKTGTVKAGQGEDKQTAEWGQDLSFKVPSDISVLYCNVEFELWHTGEIGQPEHIGTGSSKLDGAQSGKQSAAVALIESEDNEQIGTLNVVLEVVKG